MTVCYKIFLKTSGSSFQYVTLIAFSFQVVISESFLFLANFIIKVKEVDSKLSNFSESEQQKNQHFKQKVYKNKMVVQIEQELRIFNLTSNYLERMRLKTRKDPKQNMSEINKKLLGLQQLRVVFVLFTQTPSLFNGSHSSNLEQFDQYDDQAFSKHYMFQDYMNILNRSLMVYQQISGMLIPYSLLIYLFRTLFQMNQLPILI
ncbi:unnamed protein product [Paramecium sonneborni]|uniref:Transmembrane protein n=1 Tax=Paramecium sonneborni TaxID=65129 RepID=A0A8S1QFN4_9CILI|nr:unnamed protein product [Paramecium sonneborni]